MKLLRENNCVSVGVVIIGAWLFGHNFRRTSFRASCRQDKRGFFPICGLSSKQRAKALSFNVKPGLSNLLIKTTYPTLAFPGPRTKTRLPTLSAEEKRVTFSLFFSVSTSSFWSNVFLSSLEEVFFSF